MTTLIDSVLVESSLTDSLPPVADRFSCRVLAVPQFHFPLRCLQSAVVALSAARIYLIPVALTVQDYRTVVWLLPHLSNYPPSFNDFREIF